MRISDWSSDVCSSDLIQGGISGSRGRRRIVRSGDGVQPQAYAAGQRLPLGKDRLGEMKPRGPFVASTVIGAVAFWLQAFGRRQNARRQDRGRGRAAELVGDDEKRAALAGEAQHSLQEVGTR